MTRVSESMVFRSMQRNVQESQNRLLEENDIATTGRRVSRSREDPAAISREATLRSATTRLESMGRASDRIRGELGVTETALNDAQNILVRARELAVAAGNGILSDEDRDAYASEVSEMREAMLGLANSRVGDRFVFAGNRTDTEPFAPDGTFNGDTGIRELEIADGRSVATNIPGSAVFSGAVDVFALLDDLSTDLANNDPATATGRLDDIGAALEQIEEGRTQTGLSVAALNEADDFRRELALKLEEAIQAAVGEEPSKAYLDLLEAQQAMQNAMLQASRILSGFSESPLL